MEKLEAAIEAILFSAGDSVETGRIAKAIGQDKTTTEKIIRNIMNIWWRLHCSQRKQY